MEKPEPPQSRLHDKLAHLTVLQRRNVLAMLKKAIPANNGEAQRQTKYQPRSEVLDVSPDPSSPGFVGSYDPDAAGPGPAGATDGTAERPATPGA
jgi:hypothetical protein